jgi:signal transduction histidine kinase
VVRIVTNLLTNALKYSPPGSPVALRLECVEHEALVSVADQGGGLSSEEQASLFSRYYRAERTRAMAPGLGLGLYVTRALVEAHGGRIWVESRPGEGATFRFTLPLHLEGGASPRPDVVQ